jgi:hypothetical protein
MVPLLKALIVVFMSYIAAEIYAMLAKACHWYYPSHWIGDLLGAESYRRIWVTA